MARRSPRNLARKHIELLLITGVVVPACLVQVLLPYKVVTLSFFFLPVIASSYYLGRRVGGLTALLSFLIIGMFAIAHPEGFVFEPTPLLVGLHLGVWGAFLMLSAVAVGSLCDRSNRQIRELRQAYLGILEILSKYLENADHYTKAHSVRVAELSCAIAAEMGLSDEEIDNIRAGALLHDIGKAEISTNLVRKASELDESSKRQVASHTLRGAELLRSTGTILEAAVPLILYHHHYYGGRPGQEGAVGDAIPLGARIIAVADAYDAIVTDRPYRTGRAPWQALVEIERCTGTQFDPKVVEALGRLSRAKTEPDSSSERRRGDAVPNETVPSLDALQQLVETESGR